jgi:protein SCO1/2
MSERLLLAVVILLVALVTGLGLFWSPELPERPLPASILPAGGDFTLTSASGPVALADYRGKAVLVYFGYTYCPDICPTSLAATAAGLNQLSAEELAQVAVIFISVDPKRDTPARLKEYAEFFHPAIVGITGTAEEVADVSRRYGVFYAEQKVDTAGDGYVVDHSSETYVIARDGRLLGKLPHGAPPEQVVAEIRNVLNQP